MQILITTHHRHQGWLVSLSLTVLILFSVGCEQRAESDSEQAHTMVPLTIQADVFSLTRAAFVNTTFPVGAQLGVALIKDATADAGTPSIYNQSSRYTLTQSIPNFWQVNTGINGLFVSTLKARAIAYYPVGKDDILTMNEQKSAITPSILPTLYMDDLSKYMLGNGIGVQFGDNVVKIAPAEVDYLIGQGETAITASTPSTTLIMNHALAMVCVRLIKADNYLGDGNLTSFTIANKAESSKPLRQGSIQLIDNKFIPATEEVSYTRTFSGYHIEENADYNDRVGFLAFPATIGAKELNISLIVDGKTYVSVTNPEALAFEVGKLSYLNFTVNASAITLSPDILVEDWTNTKDQEFVVE